MRAAAGRRFVVVLRNEFRDGLGKVGGERRPIRRRPEAHLGIHRQGRQALARLFRTPNEVSHLANDPCAEGDEIARGQPVNFSIGIDGDRAQGARRNDVGSGRRDEQPFRQPAPLSFLGQPHQPVRFQRAQVVVDLLPSQADPRGQCRRRGGRGQLGEESASHRLQGHRRRRRIIDDLDVEHEEDGIIDNLYCQAGSKAILAGRIAEDQQHASTHALWESFTKPQVWFLGVIYFCLIAGLYGAGFWLTTLIRRTGVESPLAIGMLTVLPNAVAAVAMVTISRRSDRTRERRWHLVVPALVGALGWLVTVRFGTNTAIALSGMSLALAGVTTSLAQFWCLPTAMLAGAAAATGIALINSIGNLAGFVGPSLIGWLTDRTGSTDFGIYALAGVMAIGSMLVLTIPARIVNR